MKQEREKIIDRISTCGKISIRLLNIGTVQSTGQNLDGINPLIIIEGAPNGKVAVITLIRTHTSGRITFFPKNFLLGKTIVEVNEATSLSKLKFIQNWTPIKDLLEEELNETIKPAKLEDCPFKQGFGFRIEIEGCPSFLFENLFSIGQCKETFPFRITQQKRNKKKSRKTHGDSQYKQRWRQEVEKNEILVQKNRELFEKLTQLQKEFEALKTTPMETQGVILNPDYISCRDSEVINKEVHENQSDAFILPPLFEL